MTLIETGRAILDSKRKLIDIMAKKENRQHGAKNLVCRADFFSAFKSDFNWLLPSTVDTMTPFG